MLEKIKSRLNKTITVGLLTLALNAPTSCCGWNTPFKEKKATEINYNIVDYSKQKERKAPKEHENSPIEQEIERIPILMYHDINNPKESQYSERYCVTPNMFRRQLQLMYDRNYVPISLEEYLENDFSSVPKGKKPYMITFDDAAPGQLRYITTKKGKLKIHPDCAVGILNEYAAKYEDFEKDAEFFVDFVNKNQYFEVPFKQKGLEKKKINHLVENGYGVQCHTTLHPFLGDENYKSLYNNIRLYNYLVDHNPEYNAIAYPFGDIPSDFSKMEFLQEKFNVGFGAFGNSYGSKAFPVDDPKFLRYNIPRIEINNDLDNLKKYVLN